MVCMYLEMIEKINPYSLLYSRDLILVCKFDKNLAERIGDNEVYISEFVIAKIFGYIPHLTGHLEITKSFLCNLPEYLNNPRKILMRPDRPNERYLICSVPDHRIALEIRRDGGVTQINTIHIIREYNLKKLEEKCVAL